MPAALESLREAKQVGELRARIVELEKALEVQTATRGLFELFTHWFGPVATGWSRMPPDQAAAFAMEWVEVADRYNITTDGTCEIPAAYLRVVAVKAS